MRVEHIDVLHDGPYPLHGALAGRPPGHGGGVDVPPLRQQEQGAGKVSQLVRHEADAEVGGLVAGHHVEELVSDDGL